WRGAWMRWSCCWRGRRRCRGGRRPSPIPGRWRGWRGSSARGVGGTGGTLVVSWLGLRMNTDPPVPSPRALRGSRALVLGTDDLVPALRLARELRPWFGVAKVGLELSSAAGPDTIPSLMDLGYDVFVDLKLFDIPTTVGKASRVLGALGARYLTLHARGEPE